MMLLGGDVKEELIVLEKDMRQAKIIIRCQALSGGASAQVSVWVTPMRDITIKTALHYLAKTPEDAFPISQASRALPGDNGNLPKITVAEMGRGEYMVIIMISRRKQGSPSYFSLHLDETNASSEVELIRK